MSRPRVEDVAPLFAALADATRLRLLSELALNGPESITRLNAGSTMSRQALTKHLEVLAAAGLVTDRRRGRERIWQVEPDRLDDARSYLDRISRQWDGALGRLKALVED
jgi:DNA-binding transcriptional ArsR family regulator